MPPLGWYYAQGLIPLGPDSSDDDEEPCELPNGRMVCGPHGFVTCGKCCVDFSFMDDVLDDEEDEVPDDGTDSDAAQSTADLDMAIPAPADTSFASTKGTGRAFPTKFTNTLSPLEVFHRGLFVGSGDRTRYVHRQDPKTALIFTDGACLNNGQSNPKAGWAFVFSPDSRPTSRRLELRGPFGDESIQSSNRAELRAVIAALQFRAWHGEGFKELVIATDSSYVVEGATAWTRTWIRNGWKTSTGAAVKNQDLWEMLLGQIERWEDEGVVIAMWHISRQLNTAADAAAKAAAQRDDAPSEWAPIMGVMC